MSHLCGGGGGGGGGGGLHGSWRCPSLFGSALCTVISVFLC